MTLKELEKRIQVLEDLEAIKKLKIRYAKAADDNYNPEEMGKLFTEDGVWDGGEVFGVYRGKKEIKEYFTRVSKDIIFAIHYCMAPDITVEGDKAYGKWYAFALGTLRGNRAFWLGGFYNDEYVKINGEWLIRLLKGTVLFLTPYEEGWAKKRFFDYEQKS